MALSIYVHIPYCLQRCRYCDFTTFEWSQIMPPDQYVELLRKEIQQRHQGIQDKEIQTLYFGGGTPSLIDADLILSVVRELANVGFVFTANAEVTIEINPATVDPQKLDVYLEAGINRFSVGAQTFSDPLLKLCGRRHSAQETRETLRFLKSHGLNYSFDLLFALPGQSLTQVEKDVEEALTFDPPHLSAYCLTVPEGHPMATGRAPDQEQTLMFERIEGLLSTEGILKYEISNFAKPGFESRHNMAYWTDQTYWGIGLSAHSYFKEGPEGVRFWNPKSMKDYEIQVQKHQQKGALPFAFLDQEQLEFLKTYEAMTDYCHMHLRTTQGLPKDALHNRFSKPLVQEIVKRLNQLAANGFIIESVSHWALSSKGQLLSNFVLEELTFLQQDLAALEPLPLA